MMNLMLVEAIAIAAQSAQGAEIFSNDLKQRAKDKWERSKALPRKQKKLMRKDALLDYSVALSSDEFSRDLFGNIFK